MKILFISETLPLDTYASEVVFFRHFIRLANEGHEIHLITDQNSYNNRKKDVSPLFYVHIIPNREWYYPPFKPHGLLQSFRFQIYFHKFVGPLIKKHQINALFGFVNGNFLLAFTAYVQKKTKLPLLSFFHDDTNELNFNQHAEWTTLNTGKILEASNIVLTASKAFSNNWARFSTKFSLLYPIPANEGKIAARPSGQKTTIGYAGSVYNEIINVLDKLSGFLNLLEIPFTIIGNNERVTYLTEKYRNVTSLPLFNTSNAANDYLINHCSMCIIPYPEQMSTMPWIKTCFPSKFIQYCKLGIPTIIIAPADSAIGKWCIENNWLLYLEIYDISRLKALINLATNSAEVKDQVAFFRQQVFDPEVIHQEFIGHLARLA